MDHMLELKISNIISEIDNHLASSKTEEFVTKFLLKTSRDRIALLMTHVAYLEGKLNEKTSHES